MKIRIFSFFLLFLSGTIFAQSNTSSNPFFIENKGQWPNDIMFKTSMDGMDVWVTDKGAIYNFMKIEKGDRDGQVIQGHVVNFKLSNPSQPKVQLSDEMSGFYNYYLSNNPDNWATEVKRYHVGQLNGVYSNIDLKYYFDDGQLVYDYIVHPNGNPSDIQFQILGSDGYSINSSGELEIQTQLGVVTHKGLKMYQAVKGQQVEVSGGFVHTANGIGIEVDNYDTSKDLIIDPIVWVAFIGGGGDDVPNDVAVGWVGSKIFTTGYTTSSTFPTSWGAYSTSLGGTKDAFVTCFSKNKKFVYSTFFGGQKQEEAFALSLDLKTNQVHIVGMTTSSNSDGFPLFHAYDNTYNGEGDVFVASFFADRGTLAYSSYYGGSKEDIGYDIVRDNDGFYITGVTGSSNLPLESALQGQPGGGKDAFIAKFTLSNQLDLSYSTYLGGDKDDEANGIGLDGAGKVYVAGYSKGGSFPDVSTSFNFGSSGGKDAFVSCLNVVQNELVYSGLLGGDKTDVANDIAVSYGGAAFITGYAVSKNYPTTFGVHKEEHTDIVDAFVTKIVFDGTGTASLGYSTFVGGGGGLIERGNALTLCGNNVLFTGVTTASDFFDPAVSINGQEAFVASLDGNGTNLTGEFIGGSGQQIGNGISSDYSGLFVVGKTNSSFGSNPLEPYSGNEDGFIVALNTDCNSCQTVIINSDQSWPTDLPAGSPSGPYSLVIVTNGATLTIEPGYEVLFCPDGILDIENDCTVDLSGTLSSYATEWRGVRMHPGSSFYGHNNAKVSNAWKAIANLSPGSVVIDCKGMEFLNNRQSVFVFNTAGLLSFRKCNFIVNDDYSIASPRSSHVEIKHLKAHFYGCQFTDVINDEYVREGIIATKCKLSVGDYCEGIQPYPCPTPYLIHSTFTHLLIGVSVSGTDDASYASIASARFNDCLFGIVNEGQAASSFYRNVFQLGHAPLFGDGKTVQVGISYLGGINGMNCVNNKFYGDPTAFKQTIGIHVNDIGTYENLIEGNLFDGLTRGNVAEKKNAEGNVGLNYTCNKNRNNTYLDFHAMDLSSVRASIGGKYSISLYKPARNTFSKTSSWHPFRDFNNEGSWIDYYHRDIGNEIPTFVQHLKAIPQSISKICPNDRKGPGKYGLTEEEKRVNRETYFAEARIAEQAKESYKTLKQSGNTQEAKNSVQEWDYHRHLMDLAADLGYGTALMDTIHYSRDTVRLWMRRFRNITGDFMLIDDYIATQEMEAAQTVLGAIPQKYELDAEGWMDYLNVQVIYDYLFEQPIEALSDEVITELREFAESNTGHACYLARKILLERGIVYLPIVTMPSGLDNATTDTPAHNIRMSVSPNPTDYYVTFDWNDFVVDGDVLIEITNQSGGLITVLQPTEGKSIGWTIENVSGATCNYRLIIGGVEKDHGVIVINK